MLIFYRNGVQIGDILEQETEEFESRVFTLNGRKTKPKWLKEKKHFGSYNWQRIGLVAGLAGSRVLTPPFNTNTSHTPSISWLFSSVTSPLPVRIPPHGGGGQLQNSSSSENKTQQREICFSFLSSKISMIVSHWTAQVLCPSKNQSLWPHVRP